MKNKSLKSLFFASFTGRVIFAVTSLIALPFLAQIYGEEGIGLIGFFNTVVMVIMVLEGGLTSNLINKLAKLKKRNSYAPERYYLHSYGMINSHLAFFVLVGGLVAITVKLLASSIANNWLIVESLDVSIVIDSIKWIGVFVGINLVVVVAQGVLAGREQQIQMSFLYTAYSIARTIGVVGYIYISTHEISVAGYFVLQVVCQCMYLAGLIYFVYKNQPLALMKAEIGFKYILSGGMYSINIFALSVTSVLVVQSDKLFLSGFIALSDYAAYSLAATVASVPYICSSALYSVVFPRFSIDVARNNVHKISRVFTAALCGVAILMAVLCSVVWMFCEIPLRILFDTDLALGVERLLPVLMLGTAIQSLLIVPFALQLANRWSSLALKLNLWLAPVYLACLFVFVTYWGALGAAYAWLMYNILSLICTVYFMIKRYKYVSESFKTCLGAALFMAIVSVPLLYFLSFQVDKVGDYQALILMLIVSGILLSIGALRFKRELEGFL